MYTFAATILMFLLAASAPSSSSSSSWNYQEHGDDWGSVHVGCQGKRQSPVDIDTFSFREYAKKRSRGLFLHWTPLAADGYGRRIKGTMAGNGHTVKMTVAGGQNFSITGGPLGGNRYRLAQFHYHWGGRDRPGSEHTVDGKRYDAEMHLVHVNDKYGTVKEALEHKDGLAVVAFLLTKNKKAYPTLPGFDEQDVAQARNRARWYGTTEENLSLSDLMTAAIAEGASLYATYRGSLTTPGCNEVVTWVVFLSPVYSCPWDYASFSGFADGAGRELKLNYRNVQPLNGRGVEIVDPTFTLY